MFEYEIKFDKWNYLTGSLDVKFDFFGAVSEDEAKSLCRFKHGDMIEIYHTKIC